MKDEINRACSIFGKEFKHRMGKSESKASFISPMRDVKIILKGKTFVAHAMKA
jgi:hypothetical protein